MEILGFDIPLIWTLLAALLTLVYLYGKRRNRFLKDAGFPGPEPDIYIGNLRRFIREGVDLDKGNKIFEEYGPVNGSWLGGIPIVNVADPDILKEILVKDFDNFTDRLTFDLDNYPLDLGIFNQTGASWRRLRNIISPTFSGSKLRKMCDGLNSCARKLTENCVLAANNEEVIDVKKYFGGFTMDSIASTAFGIDTDSQNDMDNLFIQETKRIFDNSFIENPVVFIALILPGVVPLMKKLGISSFPSSSKRFFIQSLKEIVKARKSEPKEVRAKRVDFLQLMLDAEDNESNASDEGSNNDQSHKKMNIDEVMGQAFLFFLAGYETTATTLQYISYILATHPDVQDNLIEEIESVLGDNEPDYDSIHKLPYMDRVIAETLRLYTVVPGLNRQVRKTTTIKGWTFPEGVFVNVPIPYLHRNPDVYPEPKKFKPERWENKSTTDSMYYHPFGHGPRHCVGMRLAQIELKIALAHVLKKVTFTRTPDTPDEIKQFKLVGTLSPKQPIHLKVKLREV